ncbi:hypothetical protein A6A06_09735 [Streptomyces sp. CB02923]|nr:hypothetical protein A6A06_09735 [Streptomyces sp. CB02923]
MITPIAAGLMPRPVGSTRFVAAESAGPESPAAFIAALSGWPSPLRISVDMGTSVRLCLALLAVRR